MGKSNEMMHQKAHKLATTIFRSTVVLGPTFMTDEHMGEMAGMSRSTANRLRRFLEGLGILKTTIEFHAPGSTSHDGVTPTWKVLTDEDTAHARIDAHLATGKLWSETLSTHTDQMKPVKRPVAPVQPAEAVTVREEHNEPVEAIAGPDKPSPLASLAPLRKDDGRAFVEAARQYANRRTSLDELMASIEKLGAIVDRDAMHSAIRFERIAELDTLSEVLPYITSLEDSVARLTTQSNTLRADRDNLRREIEPLRREVNKLKEANGRLAQGHAQTIVSQGRTA